MDMRILKYFLAVAREGNITKAAQTLHVTQPTLSRQLIELENELETTLLVRGKRHITLTASGILFQQRAQEIVALFEKTHRDIAEHDGAVGGIVSIGCVETSASLLLPDAIEAFSLRYPMIQYEIYSANGDDLRDKIDNGQIDAAVLIEPIETAKYDYIPIAFWDIWGVLMRKDDPLASKSHISTNDIIDLPLFLSRRHIVKEEVESWFGGKSKKPHILVYHDFITNIMLLIERGLGYAVTVQGSFSIRPNENLHFVPFSPERKSGHVLAWKKNRIFNQSASLFIEYVKRKYHA